jgi:hypothetical protein
MQCPQCGARTEVSKERGPFRDRRCTNAACGIDFTTCEHLVSFREHHRPCARTRATQTGTPKGFPPAGVEEDAASAKRAADVEVNSTSSPVDAGANGTQQAQQSAEKEARA